MRLAKIAKETDPEKELLKRKVADLETDLETKQRLREENQALFEKV